MIIAQTCFWIDRDGGSIGIRSVNRRNDTNPIECYLSKRPRWLDFNVYESTGDDAVELRLSLAFLWLSLNVLICILPARNGGHRFDDRDRMWGWSILDNSVRFGWGSKGRFWDLPFVSFVCEK